MKDDRCNEPSPKPFKGPCGGVPLTRHCCLRRGHVGDHMAPEWLPGGGPRPRWPQDDQNDHSDLRPEVKL